MGVMRSFKTIPAIRYIRAKDDEAALLKARARRKADVLRWVVHVGDDRYESRAQFLDIGWSFVGQTREAYVERVRAKMQTGERLVEVI